MQTFITNINPVITAKLLDNKRLGKQRIEAIQIARTLFNLSNGWKNHPIVKMWKGYEPYLIKIYLKSMMDEWERRGYKNNKSIEHYNILYSLIENKEIKIPDWFTEELFNSHKSNLIRKNNEFYSKYWKNIPDNLPYVWFFY